LRFVQRLFETSRGPVYIEVDYDGAHVSLFGDDGRPSTATDASSTAVERIACALRNDLGLPDVESRGIALQLQADLENEHDEEEDASAWRVFAPLLATLGVWLVGAAALTGGIVYLILQFV